MAVLAFAAVVTWHSPALANSDSTAGICGRTQQVQDAILAKLSDVSDCANVTDTHLSGITGELTLPENISALKPDDFAGLDSLETLYLVSTQISALPEGVFDGLDSLEFFDLSDNKITTLPEDVFDGLDSLKSLRLSDNQISALPEDLFDELDSLEYFNLSDNQISALPEDVFDGLDNLKSLRLSGNRIGALPEDVFDGLGSLGYVYLQGNRISALPEDVFDGLDSLEWLNLSNNQITTLPEDVFDGLDSLVWLHLQDNQIGALPEDVFDRLDSLGYLYLQDNEIGALPEDVFNGLSRLRKLNLSNNQIAELPDGILDGIGGLATLYLGSNPGAPFTFTVELEQQGDDAVVIGVAKGAPSRMRVSLSAEGGILDAETFTIAAGSTKSDPIFITPSGDGEVTVNVDSAEFVGRVVDRDYARTSLGDSLVLNIVTSESNNSNSPATGAPTVSGTAQVGETLTVDTSGISDEDGLDNVSYSYQWLAAPDDDTEIDGATSSTYALQSSDSGKAIKVQVSFTDDAGNDESLTSTGTTACGNGWAVGSWISAQASGTLKRESPDEHKNEEALLDIGIGTRDRGACGNSWDVRVRGTAFGLRPERPRVQYSGHRRPDH